MLCCCLLAAAWGVFAQPVTDIADRHIQDDRSVLKYQPLREADIFWECRLWRVIDVREKMNLSFAWPAEPLFDILRKEAKSGNITLYDPLGEGYSKPYDMEELDNVLARMDTIQIYNTETHEASLEVVYDEIFAENIKRYRVEEIWFFDSRTSTMRVRIIGLAPMVDVTDENGNFLYEKPLFWVNFPESREALDAYQVYHTGNDSHRISWTDQLEMRRFSSYVYKGPDMGDRRLKDMYSGVDLLMHADRINAEVFNFEHDLWSY